MRFRVNITRKEGLSDPEGVEIARALADLGYDEVGEVHFGRIITLDQPRIMGILKKGSQWDLERKKGTQWDLDWENLGPTGS